MFRCIEQFHRFIIFHFRLNVYSYLVALLLIFQISQRNNKNTIISAVSNLTSVKIIRKDGSRIFSVFTLSFNSGKCIAASSISFNRKFHFNCCPTTIVQYNNCICFQTTSITIMKNLAFYLFYINTQIPITQGFKKNSKIIEIFRQSGWSQSDDSSRN